MSPGKRFQNMELRNGKCLGASITSRITQSRITSITRIESIDTRGRRLKCKKEEEVKANCHKRSKSQSNLQYSHTGEIYYKGMDVKVEHYESNTV
jgi:hypothetical protein